MDNKNCLLHPIQTVQFSTGEKYMSQDRDFSQVLIVTSLINTCTWFHGVNKIYFRPILNYCISRQQNITMPGLNPRI